MREYLDSVPDDVTDLFIEERDIEYFIHLSTLDEFQSRRVEMGLPLVNIFILRSSVSKFASFVNLESVQHEGFTYNYITYSEMVCRLITTIADNVTNEKYDTFQFDQKIITLLEMYNLYSGNECSFVYHEQWRGGLLDSNRFGFVKCGYEIDYSQSNNLNLNIVTLGRHKFDLTYHVDGSYESLNSNETIKLIEQFIIYQDWYSTSWFDSYYLKKANINVYYCKDLEEELKIGNVYKFMDKEQIRGIKYYYADNLKSQFHFNCFKKDYIGKTLSISDTNEDNESCESNNGHNQNGDRVIDGDCCLDNDRDLYKDHNQGNQDEQNENNNFCETENANSDLKSNNEIDQSNTSSGSESRSESDEDNTEYERDLAVWTNITSFLSHPLILITIIVTTIMAKLDQFGFFIKTNMR